MFYNFRCCNHGLDMPPYICYIYQHWTYFTTDRTTPWSSQVSDLKVKFEPEMFACHLSKHTVLWPKTSKTLFGPVNFSVFIQKYLKINSRIWFGPVNSNFHFKDFAHIKILLRYQLFNFFSQGRKSLARGKNRIIFFCGHEKSNFLQNLTKISWRRLQGRIVYFLHFSSHIFLSMKFSNIKN